MLKPIISNNKTKIMVVFSKEACTGSLGGIDSRVEIWLIIGL